MVAALRREHPDAVVMSARTGEGADALRARIAKRLPTGRHRVEAMVPYDRGDLVAAAHDAGEVHVEEHHAEGTRIVVDVDRDVGLALGPFSVNGNAWVAESADGSDEG